MLDLLHKVLIGVIGVLVVACVSLNLGAHRQANEIAKLKADVEMFSYQFEQCKFLYKKGCE